MILIGDCRETLKTLPAESVQTCVTSPPYFGLRDYGHESQIGLEETPDQYVAQLVEVFREVRRVLRDDGTLWLNLGDSYAGNGTGLKPKDLTGIPWRVAFALQAGGWWLRQDIIWAKPNPMPESVRDRCTKAHEYVFLLSKSASYFFDAKAIQEPAVKGASGSAFNTGKTAVHQGGRSSSGERAESVDRNRRSVWTIVSKPYAGAHFATMPPELAALCIQAGSRIGDTVLDPFLGSGTTGEVAESLGRRWIGCELNPEYVEQATARTAQVGLPFGQQGMNPAEGVA